ncbi:MAG: site-specific DNA-methyltransferase [Micrococcales bacterium]|nr:site-specific DNA-methyltransferase [Micrococcales bacterium]MCL2667611.1 site-specific DNA-methyltransferase [Micrococcales bacterium]
MREPQQQHKESGLPRGTILGGDAATVMRGLPDHTIDQIFFFPPYFRLRDYGVGKNKGELGHETSVDEWVANLRAVCIEARRLLTPTGSLWINLGDTYSRTIGHGATRKSLLLGPERLALALVADGWLMRNSIVWAKANHMPESVGDRLTSAWEHLYFLTPESDYFFDLDAIRLPHTSPLRELSRPCDSRPTGRRDQSRPRNRDDRGLGSLKASGLPGHPLGKNPTDVWTLPTSPKGVGHSAAMPLELAKRAIAAACPERRCVQCRKPFKRDSALAKRIAKRLGHTSVGTLAPRPDVPLLPTCGCKADSEPGVVLDPFMGSGTTAIAAEQLGRDWLGVELSAEYVRYAETRIARARKENSKRKETT